MFLKYAQDVFMKNAQKVPKQRKGVFRARKTLQKFGYRVLRQMRATFFQMSVELLAEASSKKTSICVFIGGKLCY